MLPSLVREEVGVFYRVDILAEFDQLQLAFVAGFRQTEGVLPIRPCCGAVEDQLVGVEMHGEEQHSVQGEVFVRHGHDTLVGDAQRADLRRGGELGCRRDAQQVDSGR